MRFNDLASAIATTIHGHMPDLVTCEPCEGRFDLAELQRVSLAAPAVLVANLGVVSATDAGTGETDATVVLAAYVVTVDHLEMAKGPAAVNLVEALVALAQSGAKWGLAHVTSPDNVRADNLYSGDLDQEGVAMWCVSWRQTVRIGQSIWTDGVLPSALYVSEALSGGTPGDPAQVV